MFKWSKIIARTKGFIHFNKVKPTDLDTYIFVDVSNIRATCQKTCGFQIDFVALAKYFQIKYPKLKALNYYEGLAKGDESKVKTLQQLEQIGYNIKTLERKAYVKDPIKKTIMCKKCGYKGTITITSKTKTLKSNVDVYLAAEMLQVALLSRGKKHIIIVSCDGDYAEAIKVAAKNQNSTFTVMATPTAKNPKKNTLSTRLKQLTHELPEQYKLFNIADIKDKISTKK